MVIHNSRFRARNFRREVVIGMDCFQNRLEQSTGIMEIG